MPRFSYQVRDVRGGSASGALVAPTLAEAMRNLRSEGNIIVDLREQSGGAAPAAQSSGQSYPGRINRDEVIFFANQLAVMVDTGVPLPDAIDGIAQQSQSEGFRHVLKDLSEQVKAGVDFSTALARYPKLFSRLMIAMIKASEASGTMGKMLQRASQYLEKQRQVRKRVKGAMAYPVAMICFCILVLIALLTFVLPRFEKIYEGKKAVLPAPTRFLLALSSGLIQYWPFILIAVVAVVVGCYLFFRRPEGRVLLDGARLKLPILGSMYRKACLARSLRTLATMIASGVSVLEGLEIAADVSGNIHYERVWRGINEKLKEGQSLSEQMANQPLIPPSTAQMVSAGERSGKLATVLDRVAGFCEEDLDIAIRTTTSFIEPVMIVVMGLIVGGIAMALLLPVFSLAKIMSH